ncbi:MAG: flagellar basal body L-ring protein FlgH [Gammaproteobacteria bacterium]|nr:flagellar basal body L-ring protein FlgH [Gammaproteobacteria bacterium]
MKTIVNVVLLLLLIQNTALAGSLYSESSYKSLTGDHRSYKVGDLLTVMIYEVASATTSTQTDTKKSSDVGISAFDKISNLGAGLDISNDFGGSGSSKQAGKLVATVSVSVSEKLNNGELIVEGEQYIDFNNDTQKISVYGRVRPQDIASDNTILSSRMADAEIEFSGEGLISSRGKPGIITRIFNWLF